MKVDIYKQDGTKAGKKAELSDDIFGIEPSENAIYEDVRRHLANKRQGTHSTKGRSEVIGSTRKLYRQKGTGSARRGDAKSPILRGGGTMFGPKPRSYSFKLNKKVTQLARKSALTLKAGKNAVMVLETIDIAEPKTAVVAEMLKALELSGKKVLILSAETDLNLYKSARNIPKVQVLEANKPNTYQIMNADYLLIPVNAIPVLEQSIQPKNDEAAA